MQQHLRTFYQVPFQIIPCWKKNVDRYRGWTGINKFHRFLPAESIGTWPECFQMVNVGARVSKYINWIKTALKTIISLLAENKVLTRLGWEAPSLIKKRQLRRWWTKWIQQGDGTESPHYLLIIPSSTSTDDSGITRAKIWAESQRYESTCSESKSANI